METRDTLKNIPYTTIDNSPFPFSPCRINFPITPPSAFLYHHYTIFPFNAFYVKEIVAAKRIL